MKENLKKLVAGALTVLTVLLSSNVVMLFETPKIAQASSSAFDFSTSSDYTYDSSKVAFSTGVAQLVPSDQTDDDNSATGFAGGTKTNTQWNTSVMELDATGKTNKTGTFTSRAMGPGSSSSWTSLAWTPSMPYGKVLPGSQQTETAYGAGNIDMSNNTLLWHMDEASWNGTTGEVLDSSGQGNPGTAKSGLTINTSTCRIGNCASGFSSAGKLIDAGKTILPTSAANVTVEAWVKAPNDSGSPQNIITQHGATSGRFVFRNGENNKLQYYKNSGAVVIEASATLGDGNWHHIAFTKTNLGAVILYQDGVQVGSGTDSGNTYESVGTFKVGANSTSDGTYFQGNVDEVAVYSRVLTATEILNRYKRGALNIQYQVRSCSDVACTGQSFIGPDGTASTYYSEYRNSSLGLPSLTLTNVSNNSYLQYQATLTTLSSTYTPQFTNVVAGPAHYPGDYPTIVNNTGITYSSISAFAETLGGSNAGSVQYQISNDGSHWYYWNGSNFVQQSGSGYPTQTNSAATINSHVSAISSDIGSGSFYFKAFLISSGSQQVQLDNLSLTYSTNTGPNAPTISNYNDGSWTNDSTPTLQFNLSDPDVGDTVKYQVQIDDTADFSSPVDDTTEVTGATTPRTGVTYTPSALSEGSYYWRVRAIDGSAATSSWTTANSGSVAFRVDVTAPISASISINSGAASTNSTSATLTLSSTDPTSGNYQMQVSEDSGFSGASWESYATSKAFTLSSGEGTKTVYARFKDNAGNIGSSASDTIIYDTTAPSSTSVTINSGDSYTTSLTASLTLAASDAGSGLSQMMVSESATFVGASWESYATSKTLSLSAGDGTKTVYAKFRDDAQNESGAVSDSIVYDVTAPTDPTIVINSDNANTNSTSVTLTLTSSDATSGLYQMMLSENADFSGGVWQSSASSAPFTLSDVDGTKTVYVKFKDNAGNVSSAASDSILLDTTVPYPTSITINSDDAYTTSLSATLSLYANELGSGISDMMLSESPTFVGASWEPFAASAAFTLSSGDGTKTVYAKFRDLANNESIAVSDSITYDATAPTGSVTINGGSTYTNSRSATLTVSALDSTSGLYQMEVSEDASFTGASWETYATSKAFTLAASDGTRTVYIRFKDNAGNVSSSYNDTIILDRSGPIVTDFNINSDATYATSVNVTLTIGALDLTSSVADMMISENTSFTGAAWESYATSKSLTLSSTEGLKTVYIKFRDAAGNSSLPTFDTITLDTTLPDGSIVINSGDGYTQSQNVTLALSASDNMTVSLMRISENADFSGASWEAYATSKAFTLSAGDGTKTVYVEYQDDAGNTSSAVSDAITFDATAPASNALTINTGNAYTASTSVTLGITSSDATSGTTQMEISESATFVGASYESYATSKAFTLSSGDGTKTVYARFKDAAGNVSSGVSDTIVLDTANPSGTISINSGDALTAVRNVTLTLSATDATSGVSEMEISESATFVGASYESYATSKSWTLSSTDGAKTVYVKLRDITLNVSETASDSIILDTENPTGTVTINAGDAITNTRNVSLGISASDTASGLSQMMISESPTFSGGIWETYGTAKSMTLSATDGTKTVYIKFKDNAGNVSSTASDTITQDTTGPTPVSIKINNGASYTTSRNATLKLTASDAISTVAYMMISPSSSFTGESWQVFAPDALYTLSAGDGNKTLYAKFKDSLGNVSSVVSASIGLDTTVPTGSIAINSGASVTSSRNVTLNLSASDAVSGVATMEISDDPTLADATPQAFASTKSFTLSAGDGTKTVYVRYTDNVGNVSTIYSDSIVFKTPTTQSDNGTTDGTGSGTGSGTTDGNTSGGTTNGGSSNGSTSGSGSNSGSGQNQNVVTVEIKVIDKSNNPVPNAEVTLDDGTKGVTNKEGVVVFESVPEGTKNVKVQYNDKVEEKQITISKDNTNVSVKVSWSLERGMEIARTAALIWAGMIAVGAVAMLVIKRFRKKKFSR